MIVVKAGRLGITSENGVLRTAYWPIRFVEPTSCGAGDSMPPIIWPFGAVETLPGCTALRA